MRVCSARTLFWVERRRCAFLVQFLGWNDWRLGCGVMKLYRWNVWVSVGPLTVTVNV